MGSMTRAGAHRRRPSRWRRAWTAVGVVVLLVIVAGVADASVLMLRIGRIDVRPTEGPGETWLLVGVDSRDDLPAGASTGQFGSDADVPGERADVVLLVHRGDTGTSTVSVPRDLVVRDSAGYPQRLTLTWLKGPQELVDSLCHSLGVPVDHVLRIDFAGFVGIVDAVGGIEIDLPHPLRDPAAGLDLQQAGRQTVNGTQALALVRSRHGEQLVDGRWVAEADGAQERADWSGVVLRAMLGKVRATASGPIGAQRLAWLLSGVLRMDPDTDPLALLRLGRTVGPASTLPVGSNPNVLAVTATAQTRQALAAAGLQGCAS
jgi:LCP family protein required for cell wall assembly